MDKINCNVIQDLLPMYIDHTACEDTKTLMEEHLLQCDSCREMYNEILEELSSPSDRCLEKNDAEELKRFKKFLSAKQFRAVLLAIAGVLAIFIGMIVFMNRYMRYIEYQEAGFTYITEDKEVIWFTNGVRGNYRWRNELDRDTGIMTIHYEQSLWDRYINCLFYPLDHISTFLKKDLIKVVYVNSDGSETTLWEASEEEKKHYFQQERGALG